MDAEKHKIYWENEKLKRELDRVNHSEDFYNPHFKYKNVYYKAALKNLPESDIKDFQQKIKVKFVKDCKFCNAVLLENEKPGMCCHNGKFKLPEWKPLPDFIMQIITGNNEINKSYLQMSRLINISFAATHVKFDQLPYQNTKPQLTIMGMRYHKFGSIEQNSERPPRFNQLYIMDPDMALEKRKSFNAVVSNKADLDAIHYYFQQYILSKNPYANAFKIGYKEIKNNPNYKLIIGENFSKDKTLNTPTVNEVAAIYDCRDLKLYGNQLVVQRNDTEGLWQTIQNTNYLMEHLAYFTIYWHGELGWSPKRYKMTNKKYVTLLDYLQYLLMIRPGKFNNVLESGNLLHQWILDMYLRYESLNFQWQIINQAKLNKRRDIYSNILDDSNLNETGLKVVMSENTPGTPKWFKKLYIKSLALVTEFGKPDLFLTFTCNKNWPEFGDILKEHCGPNTDIKHRIDLISRVFSQKVKDMNKAIYELGVLGKCVAYNGIVEWQKRGMPHYHCIIFLAKEDKIDAIEKIDKLISCKIPPKEENEELHNLVAGMMIHGPCDGEPSSPCMKKINGILKCSKEFPKDFSNQTTVSEGCYPQYARPSPDNFGGQCEVRFLRKKKTATSRNVVPYNPFLLQTFKAHINLEILLYVSAFKYIYKYITKGSDKANFKVVQENNAENKNEILEWQTGKYTGSIEAAHKILGLPLYHQVPAPIRLDLHLPGEQCVTFDPEEDEIETIRESSKTKLTAYFDLNKNDNMAKNFYYIDIPKFFAYNQKDKKWTRRKKGPIDSKNFNLVRAPQIGLIYPVIPSGKNGIERFALNLLLINIKGPTSFESLRTVNGIVKPSFKEAAIAHKFLEHDM